MAFALTSERQKEVDEVLTRYPNSRAALLPVLWICQRQHGWCSPELIAFVADRLSLPTSAVKGVVTFYTMFHEEPVGEHVIWVCRTISCDLMGGKAIQEHLEDRLGCHAGQTSSDGKFTLLKAECLAACGQAPMVQIDDLYYENLDTKELDRVLDEVAKQEPWFEGSAPASVEAAASSGADANADDAKADDAKADADDAKADDAKADADDAKADDEAADSTADDAKADDETDDAKAEGAEAADGEASEDDASDDDTKAEEG